MMADYGKIEYFVIDVDGTMTDAGIYYDDSGNELKKFCTKDAAGFFTAHAVGMKIIVLTGRECKAVTRRMQEMSVEYICQNIKDKKNFLISFLKEHGIEKEQLGYIGDDLNDLSLLMQAGLACCAGDAQPEVKKISHVISGRDGGNGVVRDIAELILKTQGKWQQLVDAFAGNKSVPNYAQ